MSEEKDRAVGEDSLPRLSQSLASEASEDAEAARAVRVYVSPSVPPES